MSTWYSGRPKNETTFEVILQFLVGIMTAFVWVYMLFKIFF